MPGGTFIGAINLLEGQKSIYEIIIIFIVNFYIVHIEIIVAW